MSPPLIAAGRTYAELLPGEESATEAAALLLREPALRRWARKGGPS